MPKTCTPARKRLYRKDTNPKTYVFNGEGGILSKTGDCYIEELDFKDDDVRNKWRTVVHRPGKLVILDELIENGLQFNWQACSCRFVFL